MDPTARHLRVKTLFLTVCDLPDAASQCAALETQGADAATLAEVMTLLGHVDAPTHFSEPLAHAAHWLDDELREGDLLGAWTLQGSLGQGGMGRVFLAVRSDGHYDQRAALKLLRGWSGPDGSARFTRERQILAKLDHPHIARLLDGGTTPRGQPYLVMALVEGQPIDAHCEAQSLGLNDRLALFDTVCSAVEHAHRQLVIHCDIKPDNVRVSADGQAQLLDFGIAQLHGQADELGAAFTPGSPARNRWRGGRPAWPATSTTSAACCRPCCSRCCANTGATANSAPSLRAPRPMHPASATPTSTPCGATCTDGWRIVPWPR